MLLYEVSLFLLMLGRGVWTAPSVDISTTSPEIPSISSCPPGALVAVCSTHPCDYESCPSWPDAECRANYCGGCFAEFYQDNVRIEDCEATVVDSATLSPLSTSNSISNSSIETAILVTGQVKAGPEKNDVVTLCPDNQPVANCASSPCSMATCASYPDASCVDNYCGGCFADFYLYDQKVDCTSSDISNNTFAMIFKKLFDFLKRIMAMFF